MMFNGPTHVQTNTTKMRVFLPVFLLFCAKITFCTTPSDSLLFVAFYNVENLFDPSNDSLTNDDSFTVDGFNRWGYSKLSKKVIGISKVIMAMNDFSLPDVVALAEVENRYVLERLCNTTPLKAFDYEIVHYDSPDSRGIDLAVLYRKSKVEILHSEPLTVVFPFEPSTKNRDVLYLKIRHVNAHDSLHLLVNHWTSRYSGAAATIPKRNYYAAFVRHKVEAILKETPNAQIIITGDFNDYPHDESFKEYLQTSKVKTDPNALINLMENLVEEQGIGTHKNKEFWGALDQIIVTGNFFHSNSNYQLRPQKAFVFAPPFLLVPDEKYGGVKNFRTYLGPRYIGGYSDHLPVYIMLKIKDEDKL